MTDETQDSPEEATATEREGPRCGERLAEARREQEISIHEVAKELHLDEPKVRALERNEFDVLGAPVFAKGHLRKYSQLVGVDEADVFADYYAMTRAEGMPPIVARRKKIRQEMSPGPWIAVAVVLLVAAAAYWWFVVRIESGVAVVTPQPNQELPATEPETLIDAAEQLPQDTPAEQEDDQVQPQADDSESAPPAPAEPVVQNTAVADQIRLSISFSGECWTEISDADGQQLFFSMGRAGQTVELDGRAPVTALFGNADNVEVLVNDNPYTLPEPNAANRTVRVAILNQ